MGISAILLCSPRAFYTSSYNYLTMVAANGKAIPKGSKVQARRGNGGRQVRLYFANVQ